MNIHPTSIIEDGVELGNNCTIGPFSIIRSGAIIGNNCSIGSYNEIRENVKIGDSTSLGSRCTISASATIGNYCLIKYGFVVTDTPNLFNPNYKEISKVGNYVLIGANVTLMPGVEIGDNAIVGACSQVRETISENEIWYGNPAKFIRMR